MTDTIPFPDSLEFHKNGRELLIESVPATNAEGILRFYTRITEGTSVINPQEMHDFADSTDAIQFGLLWIRRNI